MAVSDCGLRSCGEHTYFCSVELTLQIIGGKWKPIILYRLCENKVMRFSEIKRSIPNITQKMLTQQLRELEADGIVHREVYPQVPPKVEYSLTDMGGSVMPQMRSLCEWGEAYAQWVHRKEEGVEAS